MNEFGKFFREYFNISKEQFIQNGWENTLVWVKTSEKKQVSRLIQRKAKINNEKRRSSINTKETKNRQKRSASVSCDVNNINKLEYQSGIISKIDHHNSKIFVSIGNNTSCFLEKDIFPRNNSEQDFCDDLTSLYYLNEICVIDLLHKRYNKDIIYTFTGKILIAINPYKNLPIYKDSFIGNESEKQFEGRKSKGTVWKPGDPHVYEIANRAYTSMVTLKENQSILVTGESGAGKTETTKILLQFFSEKSKLIQKNKNKDYFENNLIGTTSILECFGNAKTLRNDNSSRFGKFITIEFDDYGKIIGGKIDIYLLEKSRLITHTKGERNYHIFYQFIQKIKKEPNFIDSLYKFNKKINYLERWNLDESHLDFHYLNPYKTESNKNEEKDMIMFNNMLYSLISIGIKHQELIKIFDMIVSILHLGNIKFFDNDKDEAIIDVNKELNWNTWLGIENKTLFNIITTKDIIVGNEKYIKKLSSEESTVLRDTFSIYIYESLFMWIVRKINQSLSNINNDKLYEINTYFIGILDIYGFESFQDNSFEQFCINYANEKLQNQFNIYFFHLEQEEYKKQGITVDYVNFTNNKECITMIENKYGILDILDEETRFPKATSQTLLLKLNSKLSKHPYFIYTNNKPNYFTIKHYADHVTYNIKNFLSKSKSTILQFNIQDIKDSLVSTIFEIGIDNIDTKQSVGIKFKNSLIDLMDVINNTDCHYIRCIKPNDTKSPNAFWSSRIIEQLKCGGVFEAIKISKTGYPNKLSFDSFINRYSILEYISYLFPHISINSPNKPHKNLNDILSIISQTLNNVNHDYNFDDKYKIGKDKIFFKVGIIPSLEEYRKRIINKSATSIQNIIRMKQSKDFMKNKLDAIILIQNNIRTYTLLKKKKEYSCLVFQKYIRSYIQQISYSQIIKKQKQTYTNNIVYLQAIIRRNYVIQWYSQYYKEQHSIKTLKNKLHDITYKYKNLKKKYRNKKNNQDVLTKKLNNAINKIEEMKLEVLKSEDASYSLQIKNKRLESNLEYSIEQLDILKQENNANKKELLNSTIKINKLETTSHLLKKRTTQVIKLQDTNNSFFQYNKHLLDQINSILITKIDFKQQVCLFITYLYKQIYLIKKHYLQTKQQLSQIISQYHTNINKLQKYYDHTYGNIMLSQQDRILKLIDTYKTLYEHHDNLYQEYQQYINSTENEIKYKNDIITHLYQEISKCDKQTHNLLNIISKRNSHINILEQEIESYQYKTDHLKRNIKELHQDKEFDNTYILDLEQYILDLQNLHNIPNNFKLQNPNKFQEDEDSEDLSIGEEFNEFIDDNIILDMNHQKNNINNPISLNDLNYCKSINTSHNTKQSHKLTNLEDYTNSEDINTDTKQSHKLTNLEDYTNSEDINADTKQSHKLTNLEDYTNSEDINADSEEINTDSEENNTDSEEINTDSEESKGDSEESKGDSEESKGDKDEIKGDKDEINYSKENIVEKLIEENISFEDYINFVIDTYKPSNKNNICKLFTSAGFRFYIGTSEVKEKYENDVLLCLFWYIDTIVDKYKKNNKSNICKGGEVGESEIKLSSRVRRHSLSTSDNISIIRNKDVKVGEENIDDLFVDLFSVIDKKITELLKENINKDLFWLFSIVYKLEIYCSKFENDNIRNKNIYASINWENLKLYPVVFKEDISTKKLKSVTYQLSLILARIYGILIRNIVNKYNIFITDSLNKITKCKYEEALSMEEITNLIMSYIINMNIYKYTTEFKHRFFDTLFSLVDSILFNNIISSPDLININKVLYIKMIISKMFASINKCESLLNGDNNIFSSRDKEIDITQENVFRYTYQIINFILCDKNELIKEEFKKNICPDLNNYQMYFICSNYIPCNGEVYRKKDISNYFNTLYLISKKKYSLHLNTNDVILDISRVC